MFWRFGGYANISTIDTILEKPDFTVEDLLDESDLIQEIKQHNSKLIEYLREDKILARLLEYVVAPRLEPVLAPPDNNELASDDDKGKSRLLPFGRPRASSKATSESEEDESEKKRNRYAYVAAEVLASDTWSIYEALMENKQLIRDFWQFLKRSAPLDPLQASYFTKVNESLFDKKTEEMIDLLKSLPDAVPDLLKHVECPMIMDLLLKIIALDRTEGGQGIVEWLYAKDVIPTLLSCMSPDRNWVVQTAAGDFLKAIITISANASQNEQQCIGPNELTRQLVSKPCVEQLVNYMLCGGNPLTVGVGIVIEVIRKNNSDYDPDVGTEVGSSPSSRDPIYLGTLLRLFAENVPRFMDLIMNAPAQKKSLSSTFGDKLEPLGFDRFKTCELMAELLHCSNMGLLNEVGSEELIAVRDAERQRLRVEGKLMPQKSEEESLPADDLTMRLHADQEDGRRLEVMNVTEEDGFEAVEPSREMNEDTSHEFVKAEEEIAPAVPSFLDKDDDDFVDEPLSSPRLNVKDAEMEEQRFDEPDLVVAPLSPRKAKAAPPVVTTDVPAPDMPAPAPTPLEEATPEEKQEEEEEGKEKSGEEAKEGWSQATQKDDESDSSVVYTPSTSEPTPHDEAEEKESPPSKPELSELTDAKAEEEKEEGEKAEAQDSQAKPEAPEPAPSAVMEPPGAKSEEGPGSSGPGPEETLPQAPAPPAPAPPASEGDAEPGAESMIIKSAEARGDDAGNAGAPVVGDFLKMQFVEYGVVPTILSFFFRYPWNNFLHNVVYDIVQQVFNGPMDRGYNPTLAVSLFEAADITTAIIRGQVASDESQAKTKTRMGYMGHLTLIAEEVVKFTERHPPELLSETVLDRVMSQDWINYVEGALAETRERDNAILGGVRPDVAMGNRPGMAGGGLAAAGLSGLGPSLSLASGQSSGSSALADAGLNGGLDLQEGGGNGIAPFAISTGPMMSGFGSSSDEDEDEAEENDEDVNNEFRAYTDPLNNNNINSSSSLNPPSIPPPPPPPPPLNIPPSRARLQLAARLAMHQKNNAAAAAAAATSPPSGTSQENGDSSKQGEKNDGGEASPLENPFGDDADEVDSDDCDDDEEGAEGAGSGWGGPGRGSWWRGVVMKGGSAGMEGKDESDDEVDVEDDEEFGDFAMPEVDAKGPGPNVVKPTAVHPPAAAAAGGGGGGGGPGQKSGFGSLWPFGNTAAGGNEGKSGEEKTGEGTEKEKRSSEGGDAAGAENPGVSRTVEAKQRTSLDDLDDEVVL